MPIYMQMDTIRGETKEPLGDGTSNALDENAGEGDDLIVGLFGSKDTAQDANSGPQHYSFRWWTDYSGADSIWIDMGAPVLRSADGRNVDGAGIAWVSGDGGTRGAEPPPDADWLLL
jgi:hypothetical protein